MRNSFRAGTAALALACSVAFAAGASAQSAAPSAPGATMTAPGAITPTPDQSAALLKSLENFVKQSIPGFQPSVGAPVPQSVTLNPMPPAAQAAVPQAKDHHIAKIDDNTILIVDPVTRQVVGVIQEDDDTLTGTTPNGIPVAPMAPKAP